MPEPRSAKNPLKSSLVSQFFHSIKVEMYIYPASVIPSQLLRYHVCWKDFLSSQLASEIWKEPRPDRHGHIERSKSTLDIKSQPGTGSQRLVVDRQTNLFPGSPRVLFVETVQGPLFLSTNQNYYCTCLQNFKRRDPFNPNFRKFRGRIKRSGNFRKVRIDNFGQPLEVVLFLFPWSYHFVRCSAPVSSVVIKKTTTHRIPIQTLIINVAMN